jgi:glycine/D-amino acid oxidase-like deaminating enzyme
MFRMGSTADVVIIGLGIAGAMLVHELRRRGAQVWVFDDPNRNAASRGAAGLISPVAGLRFGVLDHWQTWWDCANDVYSAMGAIEPITCYRLLYGDDEHSFWKRKSAYLLSQGLAQKGELPTMLTRYVQKPVEVVSIHPAARVDTSRVLDTITAELDADRRLLRRRVEDDEIVQREHGWRVAGVDCKHVVFCQGASVAELSRFQWLPRMFARGQRIAGRLNEEFRSEPLWLSIRGKSLLLNGSCFSFGSTFDWDNTEPVVTEEATEHLRMTLSRYLHVPFHIEQTWAGVRPIMADLKPVIGEHPEYPHCWIFNGLGARGFFLAPYLAKVLARALDSSDANSDELIPPQFALRRFWQSE